MLGHDSDQFRIRPFRPAEPQIIIGRTAPAQEFTRPYPSLSAALISAVPGGFLRYSTMVGSMPRARIDAKTLREVAHLGLCQMVTAVMPSAGATRPCYALGAQRT